MNGYEVFQLILAIVGSLIFILGWGFLLWVIHFKGDDEDDD